MSTYFSPVARLLVLLLALSVMSPPSQPGSTARVSVASPAVQEDVATPRIELVHDLIGQGNRRLIAVNNNRAYIGQNDILKVFDVRNPDQPVRLASIPVATDLPENATATITQIKVREYLLYVVYTTWPTTSCFPERTLVIIDVRQPVYPVVHSRYVLGPGGSGTTSQVHLDDSLVYYYFHACRFDALSELRILDVRDLANPTLRGHYPVPQYGQVARLPQEDPFAYIISSDPATDTENLQIIDVSNPDDPVLRGSIMLSHVEMQNMYVVDSLAYLFSGITSDHPSFPLNTHQFDIIDLRNPDNPVLLRSLAYGYVDKYSNVYNRSYRLRAVTGEYAYISSQYYTINHEEGHTPEINSALSVFDIREPTDTTQVASYNLGKKRIKTIQVIGNLIYLNTDVDLQIIDGATRRGSFAPSGDAMRVAEGFYYGSRDGGLIIADVRNPDSPTLRGNYSAFSVPKNRNSNIYFADNRVYITETHWVIGGPALQYASDLYVVDITDLDRPVKQSQIHLGTRWYRDRIFPLSIFAVRDALVYIYDATEFEIQVVNVQDPANPTLYNRVPVPLGWQSSNDVTNEVHSVQSAGSLVYIGYDRDIDSTSGETLRASLEIVDTSDPDNPTLRGEWLTNDNRIWGEGTKLHVLGTYVFVVSPGNDAQTGSSITIFDVSDPDTPVLRSSFTTPGTVNDLQMVGTLVYIANGQAGLQIVDLSDAANPVIQGSLDTPGTASEIHLVDNLAYIADGAGGMLIVDVSDPANPVLHGSFDTPGNAQHLQVTDQFAYVADGPGGLQVLDVQDTTNPVLFAGYSHRTVAGDLHVMEDFIVAGSLVFRLARPQAMTVSTNGATLTAPDTSTSLTFPANSFTTPVTVTLTEMVLTQPPQRDLVMLDKHTFEVTVVVSDTQEPAQPIQPYTLTVGYQDYERGLAVEETLAFYWWDGSQWVKEPDSRVDPVNNTITATPDHFGLWTIMGEPQRIFLPIVGR